jgi:hypothetical protein
MKTLVSIIGCSTLHFIGEEVGECEWYVGYNEEIVD